MKTNYFLITMLLLLSMTSCSTYYRTTSRVERDGSMYREIYAQGDSAFIAGDKTHNPFLFQPDANWQLVNLDSTIKFNFWGEEEKLNVKACQKLSGVDGEYFTVDKGKEHLSAMAIPMERVKKSFRWFYTYYIYTATYKELQDKGPVPLDNYLNKEEQMIWLHGNDDAFRGMNGSEMNKRAVENLIRSGAFDSMGARRSQLIKVYESVMDSVAAQQRDNVEGQMDFFSMAADNDEKSDSVKEIPLPDIPEYTPEELMTMEKATTGRYLSGHPMDHYRDAVRKLHAPTIVSIIEDFSRENGPERFADGQRVTIAGVITSSKTKTTKNNSLMAYVMVEDDTASMELLCFSRVLETCGAYMKENQAVVVKGRLSVRDEKAPQIMCDSIYPLSTVEGGIPEPQPKQETAAGETLFLKFPSIDDPAIRHMKLVFQMFPGKSVVKMVMADTRKVYATQALLHPALVQEAQETLGHENVVVK